MLRVFHKRFLNLQFSLKYRGGKRRQGRPFFAPALTYLSDASEAVRITSFARQSLRPIAKSLIASRGGDGSFCRLRREEGCDAPERVDGGSSGSLISRPFLYAIPSGPPEYSSDSNREGASESFSEPGLYLGETESGELGLLSTERRELYAAIDIDTRLACFTAFPPGLVFRHWPIFLRPIVRLRDVSLFLRVLFSSPSARGGSFLSGPGRRSLLLVIRHAP